MSPAITTAESDQVAGDDKGNASRPEVDGQLKTPPSPLSDSLSEIVVSALGLPFPASADAKQDSDDTHDRNGTSPPSLLSEGERWLERLKEDDRIRVEDGIESILAGSLFLVAKKCYDAALKERQRESVSRRDKSLKVGQQNANNSPPRHRLADTSSVGKATENSRSRERESSTRSRELAGNDESRLSQRRNPDPRRGDDSRARGQVSYGRDRKRPISPTQDRGSSYRYASRDRYYGNAPGPQHLPYESFRGPGQVPPASPMHGYDNRPQPSDADMPPPSHYHYGSYNPLDDANRYRPPPPHPAEYSYPVDNRQNYRDGDWNRRNRSPDRDRPPGATDDRGSREERKDSRRRRDKESIRSMSSSATSPGLSQSRGDYRRGTERDDLDHHSAPREGRASERTYRGRSPSPQHRGARLDSRPSEKERQPEHNHKARTSSDGARRPPSPLPENNGAGDDDEISVQRRSRTSRDDDYRKERGGSERRGENGRDRRHGDKEKRREYDGRHERSSQDDIAVDVDRALPDDVSPRSRKSSRRKRHRSKRSRSRSPSSEGGRHRKSSRRRGRRSRGDSSVDSSSDDDESDRRGGRKHRHRSRRRRHRSRSDSGDESHAKKRSKKKRKDRRKGDGDDRRKGDGDRKDSGRDRDESDRRKDLPPGGLNRDVPGIL
jgi:hypothetical protein